MHTANPLSDMLGLSPGKTNQLQDAMEKIFKQKSGVVVLLRDMTTKLDIEGTSSQTLRKYGIGAQILLALGIKNKNLLTNSEAPKIVGLDGYGLRIVGCTPIN